MNFKREDILECLKMTTEALEQQQKEKWVPVTERLPEESDTYFVTVHDEDLGFTTAFAYYLEHENRWSLDDEWIDGPVIAWMPLPEPYKPESEDKE